MDPRRSESCPGTTVEIGPDWARHYRIHGSPLSGVLVALSPNRAVARVRMDELGDSYVLAEHLEPVIEAPATTEREVALAA